MDVRQGGRKTTYLMVDGRPNTAAACDAGLCAGQPLTSSFTTITEGLKDQCAQSMKSAELGQVKRMFN